MQYLPFILKDGFQKDVDVKNRIGDVKYQFTQGTFDLYTYGVYKGMLDTDPFVSLEEVTQGLSKSLHYASINAFLHIIGSSASICDRDTQNSW